MDYLNLATGKYAILASDITDSDTSLDVLTGQGANFIEPPSIAVMALNRSLEAIRDAEHIRLDSRSVDNFTITRAIVNAATAHIAGTYLLGFWSPAHFEQFQDQNTRIEGMLNQRFGRTLQDVVLRKSGAELAVSLDSGLIVDVEAGYAFVNYGVYYSAAIQLTFVAPTTSTRVDIVQCNLNTQLPEIKQGVEGGSAPTVDTGCMKIAEVTVTTTPAITLITDTRVF